MKTTKHRMLSTINILFLLALVGMTALFANADIANAADLSSEKEMPLIQYDDDDMAPPIPDTPQAPEPGDIDDPALSPDSVITEPDPPIDQTEPYIIEPETEVVDEPVINEDVNVINEPEPEAGNGEAVEDEPGPAVEEPEAVVNEPDPVVNQDTPIVDDE